MAIGIDNGFSWTAATGMLPLPLPYGGTASRALGVSGDGTIIVGYSVDVDGNQHACMWAGGRVTLLNEIGGATGSVASAISNDGGTIVGNCRTPTDTPVYWLLTGGNPGLVHSLPLLNDGEGGQALAVSQHGGVIVGYATDGGNFNIETAVKWTVAGPTITNIISGIPFSGSGVFFSIANCVNSDGSIIGGTFDDVAGTHGFTFIGTSPPPLSHTVVQSLLGVSLNGLDFSGVDTTNLGAASWTASGGKISLPGANSPQGNHAQGISGDGTIIVGQNVSGAVAPRDQACYWTTPFGSAVIVLLGVMQGGARSYAMAASTNGSAIVGYGDFNTTFLPAPSPDALAAPAPSPFFGGPAAIIPLTPEPFGYKDFRVVIDTEWSKNGEWCILQSYPMPITITAVIPEIEVGDTPSQ